MAAHGDHDKFHGGHVVYFGNYCCWIKALFQEAAWSDLLWTCLILANSYLLPAVFVSKNESLLLWLSLVS